MKFKHFSIICSIFLIMLCGACSSSYEDGDIRDHSSETLQHMYIDSDGYCRNINFSTSEKRLSFDTKVRMPRCLDSIYYYTISVSENHFSRMVEELILKNFTNYKQNAFSNSVEYYASEDESTYAFLNIDDSGHLYYDTSNGISGVLIGELYEYQFFESSSCYDMPAEKVTAIEIATTFAETYSDLVFLPYRTLVEYDNQKNLSCFQVYLQAEVDGIPICELSSNPTNSFMAKFNISPSGVTYFQGKVCFDNIVRSDPARVLTYDEIMDVFKNSISYFMYKDSGIVYDASLEYHAQLDSDGTYSLRPIWCFHIRYDDGSFDTITFFADTGDLCHTGVS